MKKNIVLVSFCLFFPLANVIAADGAKVDIDVHASTLGYGAGFAIPVTENISGRLNINKYSYNYDNTSESVDYKASLKLETIGALVDWHIFSGVTHLTAGAYINNNEISMTATPSAGSKYTYNGVTYDASVVGSASATVTFNKVAPYLGIGWSGRASKTGFSFKSDLGVMYHGAPKAKLSATGAAGSSQLAADLAAEETKMNNSLSSFNWWPVISVGMGYAF